MSDIKILRNPPTSEDALRARNMDPASVDQVAQMTRVARQAYAGGRSQTERNPPKDRHHQG